MAYHLLTNYDISAEITSFIDKYDFYIFPVVNPDGKHSQSIGRYFVRANILGFIFTQTNDRLWRKNRQSTNGSWCIGHDINRNWPYQWTASNGGGASTNPCADDFKGSIEGDTPETQAISKWMKDIKAAQGLKLFIDYHSYSQLFMTREFLQMPCVSHRGIK
jgi:hypothetical protein